MWQVKICIMSKPFLSTLSLRRATGRINDISRLMKISIHALLAESDDIACGDRHKLCHFYPRSPCGERLVFRAVSSSLVIFLSTLSLRRATLGAVTSPEVIRFLSTLSLRRATPRCQKRALAQSISIHALLAESDGRYQIPSHRHPHFYPRSPCGERPAVCNQLLFDTLISIHALLAESDILII